MKHIFILILIFFPGFLFAQIKNVNVKPKRPGIQTEGISNPNVTCSVSEPCIGRIHVVGVDEDYKSGVLTLNGKKDLLVYAFPEGRTGYRYRSTPHYPGWQETPKFFAGYDNISGPNSIQVCIKGSANKEKCRKVEFNVVLPPPPEIPLLNETIRFRQGQTDLRSGAREGRYTRISGMAPNNLTVHISFPQNPPGLSFYFACVVGDRCSIDPLNGSPSDWMGNGNQIINLGNCGEGNRRLIICTKPANGQNNLPIPCNTAMSAERCSRYSFD
ncbi:MAG: hypothetical protein H7A24_03330 [Leptospiraceae bacterium]|nr:hypothetical protein [Leptospiraceae bacterium]MCP5510882.1 hypothetical protein [Leptospiraceae bacterium]